MSFTERLRKPRLTHVDLAGAREVMYRVFCSLVLAIVFIYLLM